MENNIEDILNIIKHPKLIQNAKILVFLSENFDIQKKILNLLNNEKTNERYFLDAISKIYSNNTSKKKLITLFLDENKKSEIKSKLREVTNYRMESNKLYIEFNPIYYREILKIKNTYEILKIYDDDLILFFSKVNVLDSQEVVVLQKFTVLIDSLIELRKNSNERLTYIGEFQNQVSEKKQIEKASLILQNYAKATGNIQMLKYLKNIPHYWQTKQDIITLYKKYSYEYFMQFCSNVSSNDNDKLAKDFSEKLSYTLE